VEPKAIEALQKYCWPGNVREIENLIERLVVLNEDGVIRIEDLPDYVVENSAVNRKGALPVMMPPQGVDLDAYLEIIENGFIQQALQRSRGNKTLAAQLLNLNRTTLIERLRKKGLLGSTRRTAAATSVKEVTDCNLSLTESEPNRWENCNDPQNQGERIGAVPL
jgi:DNA-binding NtrC family response regulator